MNCVFCKIAKREIPSKVVYENERAMAFYDINPKAPIHILIIPKRHYTNLFDKVESEDVKAIMDCIRNVISSLDIGDYRIVSNSGKGAGQEVFHLHIHLLAGKEFPAKTV